jgi:aflatoxin B1 aldehyde reductase
MERTVLGTMNIHYMQVAPPSASQMATYKSIIENYLKTVAPKDAILDTAYYYGNTATEAILGEIIADGDALPYIPKITTKVNPWYENDFTNNKLGQLNKDGINNQLNTSLKNLKMDNVEILYLHCPDYETPIIETLETCNTLWRKDKFKYFGLSNFSLFQTTEILNIIEDKQFMQLKYYQGMYNLISRKVEEIFPLLNEYNIDFWAYNPLAGGLLTGKYKDCKNISDLNKILSDQDIQGPIDTFDPPKNKFRNPRNKK